VRQLADCAHLLRRMGTVEYLQGTCTLLVDNAVDPPDSLHHCVHLLLPGQNLD
jgi:hypothetical protein